MMVLCWNTGGTCSDDGVGIPEGHIVMMVLCWNTGGICSDDGIVLEYRRDMF
jgi:hypothetical protein